MKNKTYNLNLQIMSLKSWLLDNLKMSIGGWKLLLFKMKKRRQEVLPESPKQEVQSTSSQSDIVLQSLDVKDKQEQMQWFQKKNDLRNVNFDLNPVWDNGHTLYGGSLQEDEYQPAAEIRAIADNNDKPLDEVQSSPSPWEDYKRFPITNYPLTPQEAHKLQPKDDTDIKKD